MRLFIAEKPSVARAIAAQLGAAVSEGGAIRCGDTVLTWCFGHMLQQAEPDHYTGDDVPRGKGGKKVWRQQDLPIFPDRWVLIPRPDAKAQLRVIGRLLKRASEVVHAGDPDREGQLLVDEVLRHFDYRGPVRRFWVCAQDPTSIARGLSALADNADFTGMGDAALARSRADWLIGMNLSRAYTLCAQRGGSGALLTVGRVQTPTLQLVVERDRQVESFAPVPYYVVRAEVRHRSGTFLATYKPPEGDGEGPAPAGVDGEGRLVDAAVADAICQQLATEPGVVEHHAQEAVTQRVPPALSLADLTSLASARHGMTAEQVLQAAQALYEQHKLTTYPRTDCGYLPEAQHADAPAVLAAVAENRPDLAEAAAAADPTRRSRTWDDGKVTAHHGIIPTMQRGDRRALSPEQERLYALIAERYVAQFHPDHRLQRTTVTLQVAGHLLQATGKVVTTPGWKAVCASPEPRGPRKQRDDEEPADQALPAMLSGDRVACQSAQRLDRRTKAPPRFTEGTLIRAMENVHRWVQDTDHKKLLRQGDGIGTSATRAAIVGDLRRRGFVAAEGKALRSTPLGRALIDALPEAVRSPTLTALYERMLRDVQEGRLSLQQFVQRQQDFVAGRVAEVQTRRLSVPANLTPASGSRPKRRAQKGRGTRRRRTGRDRQPG